MSALRRGLCLAGNYAMADYKVGIVTNTEQTCETAAKLSTWRVCWATARGPLEVEEKANSASNIKLNKKVLI